MRTSDPRTRATHVRLVTAVAGFAAGVVVAAVAAAAPAVTPEQLLRLQNQLLAALTTPDPAAAGKLMSDRLIYIHTVGLVMTKQQEIERLKEGRHSVAEAKDTTVQIYSDTALLTGEVQYRNTPGTVTPGQNGEPQKARRYEISTLWAREGNAWRVVFWQATPIVENMH